MSWNPIDYSEECDYNCLKRSITNILKKYFEADDFGNSNLEYDSAYSAEDAIDDIHDLIGDYHASSVEKKKKTEKRIKLEVSDIDWDMTDENGCTVDDAVDIVNAELPAKVELTISEAEWLDKDNLDGVVADLLSDEYGWCINSCYYNKIGEEEVEVNEED